MASRPGRSRAKPAATKTKPTPCGIEVLTQDEIAAIGRSGEVSEEQKQRVFGLAHDVRHPGRTFGEDAKGGGQKWNPNCFMGLGWKPAKEGKKGKEKQTAEFESALVRPARAPYGGLKNHGATCYMNSMLQCLFFNMPFRKGIMQLAEGRHGMQPGFTSEEGFKPITELQRIFSHLQLSKARSYDPKAFIDGLKLPTSVQQDAQEFMKMYLTYIESELFKHSGIPSQLRNLVKDNFSGKYAYCTTCKECDTKSPNEVPFYDLDLKVQGIKHLEESLDDFFKEDELIGDNKYQCSTCDKKTEARRGIELLGLPTVLNLQLLRFVYDVNSNSRRKVSSFINFPKELDLGKWLKRSRKSGSIGGGKRRKVCSDAADESDGSAAMGNCMYDLEAIVLHTGASAVQGHYVAHVKHPQSGAWLRFDDEHVSSLEDDEYFGNAEALAKAKKKRKPEDRDGMEGRVKSRDAYMLIYRRRTAEGGECAVSKAVEAECEELVPHDWREEIRKDSIELEEQAKVAEETSRTSTVCRANEQREKEEVWDVLPDDGNDGFWIGTDWLKHWVSMDPQEKCDKIDTRPITSKHMKADPLKVHEMKLISKTAFERLRDKHGMVEEANLLERKDLCVQTIRDECERRSKSQSTKTLLDTLKLYLMSTPNSSDAGACWLSKQWCKERITGAGKGDQSQSGHPLGHEVYCSDFSNRKGQDGGKCGASKEEVCLGRGLTPDKAKRRLVTAEFVEFLQKNWQGELPAMVPASQGECSVCARKAEQEEAEREIIKNERKSIGQEFKAVLAWSPIKLKPGATYYLLHYEWVDKFQDFVDIPEITVPGPIDNLPLMTASGDKLAVDPGDLTPLDQPKFLWLEEPDWRALQGRYHGGPEIQVRPQLTDDKDGLRDVTVNRPPPKSSQASTHTSYVPCECHPEVCLNTIEKEEARRKEERLNYTDAMITITRHSASASAIAQPALNSIASSAALATGGGSRRGRPRKGEIQATVSSTSTVKAVKLQIYEKLHFSPAEQKLMYESIELEEGDKTLGEYGVPRDAVVRLDILSLDGDIDEMSARIKGKDQREADAGFSGTLLSGTWTRDFEKMTTS